MTTRLFLSAVAMVALAAYGAEPSKAWVSDNGNGTYTNPIIHADYSDPDVCRAGDDYYLTASSFNCTPGLPILHSKDLVNWTIVNHALEALEPSSIYDSPRHAQGVFAPSIRYHNEWFYIYWGDPDQGIFMVRTKNPKGKWEKPVMVKEGRGFIDPCPLWDEDGSVYLVHALAGSRIRQSSLLIMNRLSAEGDKVTDGQGRVVFDGHGENPTIEGPKLYKRGGYYWIFAPAGGVGTGWQLAMRSKDIYGPYEFRTVLARGNTPINGPHQGGWVTTPDGKEDWFIHFQHKKAYGRVLHLQPMQWREDGWPVMGNDRDGDGVGEPVITHRKPNVGKTYPVASPQDSDEFGNRTLGLQWQWQANNYVYWCYPAGENGYLRLLSVVQKEGKYGNMLDCPNLLLQKFPAEEFSATAKVTFQTSPRAIGQKAGIIVMGYDYATLAFENTTDGITLSAVECYGAIDKKSETVIQTIKPEASTLWLKVEVGKEAKCRFSYSADGKRFTKIGNEFTARAGGWIGAKMGVFCNRPAASSAGGWMDVDYFRVLADGPLQAQRMDEIKASLTIPNQDDIRGNITLANEVQGATITWKSSNRKVITDKDEPVKGVNLETYKTVPAGVVERQKKDTRVTLTATIKKGQETATKSFDVVVKAKPELERLEAYIFPFFPSNREEQVYLAAGRDPLHFVDLNGGKPILESTVGNRGVRDPYVLRSHEGDRFFLIATDLKVQTQGFETEKGSLDMVVWESTDLVNWTEPRLADLGARAFIREDGRHLGCVYAPEAIYDELTGEYVVFWASRIYPDYPQTLSGRRYQVFYSKTRDFVHFTPGKLYIERGATGDIIDTSMIRASDGKYYRVSADGAMSIETADYILGEWKKISDLTTLHTQMNGYKRYWESTQVELRGKLIEGPEFFKFNNEDVWGLYSDNYQKPGLGYIPITTTDISDTTGKAWQLYTRDQYSFGKMRKRHGSIMGVTEKEYLTICQYYLFDN